MHSTLGTRQGLLKPGSALSPACPLVATGRVGHKRAELVTKWIKPDQIHVECRNNPSFWLSVDLDARLAHGSVKGCRHVGTALFVVHVMTGGRVRVNHPLAPWFWLDLTPSPPFKPCGR